MTFEDLKEVLLAWTSQDGMSTSTLLHLPRPMRPLLQKIMRQGSATFDEIGKDLQLSSRETEEIALLLVECGFLKTAEANEDGQMIYRIRHSKTRRPEAPVAVWELLLDDDTAPPSPRKKPKNGNA